MWLSTFLKGAVKAYYTKAQTPLTPHIYKFGDGYTEIQSAAGLKNILVGPPL